MRRRTIVASAILACVVVALLLVFDGARFGKARGGEGCSSEGEEDLSQYLDFPYTIEIAPENRLYIHGYEITGNAVCTWAPGDTMRINGLAVLPTPPSPKKVIPEQRLSEIYGDVPFVQRLVASGSTWREASGVYNQRRMEVYREAGNRYWDSLERTGSEEEARRAVLDSLDLELTQSDREPRIAGRLLYVTWEGLPSEETFDMSQRPSSARQADASRIPSEAQARAKLTALAKKLESHRKPWLIVIRSSGEAIIGGESQVRRALEQIREATQTGVATGSVLNKQAVEEIVSRGGGHNHESR